MAKTKSAKKQDVPFEVPTLSRWLAADPKARIKLLAGRLTQAREKELAHESELVRMALAWAMDGEPEVFFPLINPWLKGDDLRLKRVAAGALPTRHEQVREKALKALKKLSQDKDRQTRLIAIDQLAQEPDEQLDLLAKWAKTPDPAVQSRVAYHLRRIAVDRHKKALALLLELGEVDDPDVAWAVAGTLYDMFERDNRPVIDVARQLAASEKEQARVALAGGFFELLFADHFDSLLPTIRSWLRQGDPNVRWTLSRALRFLRVTPRSLQLLRALFDDKDPEVRRRVVRHLLGAFDPKADQFRPIADMLRRAKDDDSRRVRDVVEAGERALGVDFNQLQLHAADFEDDGDEGDLDDSGGDDEGDDDDF